MRDLRTDPVKCRCACHRSGTVAHFVPCCCVHRYKRNCPHCARERREVTDA